MRKRAVRLCLLLLCADGIVVAQSRRWHVPAYQGLTLGKSTKAEVERASGQPVWSGHPIYNEPEGEVKDEILDEFENVGGFAGRTSVYVKSHSGVVQAISLYPYYQKQLSLEKAIGQFGKDYIERESALGPCPTVKEIRNFKRPSRREHPIFLVYPHKGMYLSADQDNNVQEIAYMWRRP